MPSTLKFTRFTQMQCRKRCFDMYKLLMSNDIDCPPASWSIYCGVLDWPYNYITRLSWVNLVTPHKKRSARRNWKGLVARLPQTVPSICKIHTHLITGTHTFHTSKLAFFLTNSTVVSLPLIESTVLSSWSPNSSPAGNVHYNKHRVKRSHRNSSFCREKTRALP